MSTTLPHKTSPPSLPALITLLQDEDDKVASLAMEQFLAFGLAEKAVAEFQESNNPELRKRVHQLGGILGRRRARQEFRDAVEHEGVSLWDGVIQLNWLYDPQCNRKKVADRVETMAAKLESKGVNAAKVAALMKDEEFLVPDEDILDVDLYLVERVLETKYGSPAVLCAVAQQIGQEAGWTPSIVLYEGRFCLLDRHYLLVDPSEGWHISRLDPDQRVHPCSSKDLWVGILTQLFLVSLVEGHLRDLYHFGDLLASLNKMAIDEALPFPLGRA